MKKTVVTLILILLSLCVNSQMYRVLNIHSVEYIGDDSYEETILTSSNRMVIIGASYITLYQPKTKDTKLASESTFTFSNLIIDGIQVITNEELIECGFDEFELYRANQQIPSINNSGHSNRLVWISTQRDDPRYKYLILQIEDTVVLHILIQKI